MATFDFRAAANTYTQDISGGTIATAENIDEVVQWVAELEPWQTPFLNIIMSSDEYDLEILQTGQSVAIDLDTHVNGAINNSTTTINVATGTGTIVQVNSVFAIYDYKADGITIDESTQENVLVTAVATDALTVVRAYGGSAVSHADGAFMRWLGTSEKENTSHTEAPRRRGFRTSNYFQRYGAQLSADKRAQNTRTWEHKTNQLIADFNREMVKQKMGLERACFDGKKRAGTPAIQSAMGGLNEAITTNVIDLSGQLLTPQLIDDALTNVWYTTDTSQKKTIYSSMKTKQLLDTTINPIRRATVSDTNLNLTMDSYTFNVGTFGVEPLRNVPEGNLYILDTSLISVRPFKGLNWHKSQKNGVDQAVDSDVMAISGDFTLEVLSEKAMVRLHNFITDPDQYGQLQQY